MIRVRTIRGIRFYRQPGTKKKAGKWWCQECGRKVRDGELRRHVAEEHADHAVNA